jgi:asparagine synthase (glutamine-hydrolysing)
MCGICGQLRFDGQPVQLETLKRMADSMIHRGPDDEGYHLVGEIGLGFRRLSIIDIQGGHQPMSDRDESVWVVFNGEIYNFQDLRRELEGYGHRFRTQSDTEVIVHGYKQWGEEVLDHLNGMFGLAIWDAGRRKLILARDRLGIKLVYYKIAGDGLCFGSEIRPILAGSNGRPAVNVEALYLFLRYRYTPSPFTLFDGIRKLAPGTKLIAENGTMRIERWWKYQPHPFKHPPNAERAAKRLLELYQRAVGRQLISDVPLGLLLSGGVDSALLLALMNLYGRNWDTFTVGYGASFQEDELADAARTASFFNADHHDLEISRSQFEEALGTVVYYLEEPIASSSIIPLYFLAARARQDVKVALIGQGPDELFGGYVRHLGIRYGGSWRALPRWMREPAKGVLAGWQSRESVARGLYSLDVEDRLERYRQVFSIVSDEVVESLFDHVSGNPVSDLLFECWGDLLPLMNGLDELGGFQFLELRSALPDELLMYSDKLSMAHSLELRVPYLDHEIVEYTERLPSSFKIRMGIRKWLHRKVCREFLPPEILLRKKRGFAVKVVNQWFRDALSTQMDDFLLDPESKMYGYISHRAVGTLLADHKTAKRNNHRILFSLVVFEQWLRTFLDR